MSKPKLYTPETIEALNHRTEYVTKEAIADWLDSISNEWMEAELLAEMIRYYKWKKGPND